jgi:hypothetical protein
VPALQLLPIPNQQRRGGSFQWRFLFNGGSHHLEGLHGKPLQAALRACRIRGRFRIADLFEEPASGAKSALWPAFLV